jgi:DNA-3-methyladenine glycosylase
LLSDAPEVVAPSLLGMRLVSELGGVRVSALITEVEAYGGVGLDAASHSHRGRTPRNGIMFGASGLLYVYRSYGMHWCLNVVTGPEGDASAVLLRAGEIVEGAEAARSRRVKCRRDRDLARGPGRLAQALGITGEQNGIDLLSRIGPVRLRPRGSDVIPVHVAGPRIGISKEVDRPWRFWWEGHPTVSR